jgi:hypothetical protein
MIAVGTHVRNIPLGNQASKEAIENGQAVYAGRQQLGNVVKSRGAFIAYNHKGKKVGKFPSALEASRAVLASAGAEPR